MDQVWDELASEIAEDFAADYLNDYQRMSENDLTQIRENLKKKINEKENPKIIEKAKRREKIEIISSDSDRDHKHKKRKTSREHEHHRKLIKKNNRCSSYFWLTKICSPVFIRFFVMKIRRREKSTKNWRFARFMFDFLVCYGKCVGGIQQYK